MCTYMNTASFFRCIEKDTNPETQGGTHIVTVKTNKQLSSVAMSSTATSCTTLTTYLNSS